VDGKAKLLGRVLSALALFSGLVGIISFVYYWDPTRTAIKRLQASDPYLYEQIDPKYLKVDPASLIRISSPTDMAATRDALLGVIWNHGGLPLKHLPIVVRKNIQALSIEERCPVSISPQHRSLLLECSADLFSDGANLAGIDQLVVEFQRTDQSYRSNVSFFRPAKPNGRLILYHHGYAGTHLDQWRHILRWVERGYAVLGFDYMGYGGAGGGFHYNGAEYLRAVFYPVSVALNYALSQKKYDDVAMIGLSAGGWVTAVYAALDPRVKKSYPVSGVLPVYLRRKKERAEPQFFAPMLEAATYLDMFVLATSPEGRRQVQFFNRFDRCCFNNRRGKLYEEEVATVAHSLGGAFQVVIDETHARHKISRWTFEEILKDMELP